MDIGIEMDEAGHRCMGGIVGGQKSFVKKADRPGDPQADKTMAQPASRLVTFMNRLKTSPSCQLTSVPG